MTQDEIKKALEICTDIYAPCNGCPYEKCTNCDNTLHTDALNVIIEQENEIEKLKDKCEELRNEKWDAQDDLDCYYDEMLNKIKQAKIKAVKDFAEKLKARITKFIWRHNIPECIFNDIMSDLLKEYEE